MPRIQRKLKKTSFVRDDITRVRGVLPTRLDSLEARGELRLNKQQKERVIQDHKRMLIGSGLSEAEAEEQTRKDWEQVKKQKETWASQIFGRFIRKK